MVLPFIGDVKPDIETFAAKRWNYANVKSHVRQYRGMRDYEAAIDAPSSAQLAGDFPSQGMEAAVINGEAAASRLLDARAVSGQRG